MPTTGHFILHSNVMPPVTAGRYELVTEQIDLPFDVEPEAHARADRRAALHDADRPDPVELPARQCGRRLRRPAAADRAEAPHPALGAQPGRAGADRPKTPWLALVVVAEGEADAVHRHAGARLRDGGHHAARPATTRTSSRACTSPSPRRW